MTIRLDSREKLRKPFIVGLDSFSKLQWFSLTPCCQVYGVAEEAWVAETAIWSIPFLINMFTALFLKGSRFYFFSIKTE